MIEVENLTKIYVDNPVVDGLSFFVPEGQILGFLGPNGAGKTTAMRMMTGFLPATAGEVVVAGIDLDADPVGLRRKIGYATCPRMLHSTPNCGSRSTCDFAPMSRVLPEPNFPIGSTTSSSAACSRTSTGRSSGLSPKATVSGLVWRGR